MFPEVDVDPLGLASQIVESVRHGRRETSYKPAFVMALIFESVRDPQRHCVDILSLADHFIDMFWSALVPFSKDGEPLSQSRRGQAQIPSVIQSLRKSTNAGVAWKPGRRRVGPPYVRARRAVGQLIAQMPATHLQPVVHLGPGQRATFLYDGYWLHKKITMRELDSRGWTLNLQPGVASALVRTSSLLIPVMQGLWEEDIKTYNHVFDESRKVRERLFGTGRKGMNQIRARLAEAQNNTCFYCQKPLGSSFQIDHVVPWSRCGLEDLSNLVATDVQCNSDKRDRLPSRPVLKAAVGRPYLEGLADALDWEFDPVRTMAVGIALLDAAPFVTGLWDLAKPQAIT